MTAVKEPRQTNVRVLYRGVWVPTYLLPHKVVMKCGRPKLYSPQLPIKPKHSK